MNREERRKSGISKETADKINELNKPCTVVEAVQLAQGVADDSIANYHRNINPIIVSLSIQIEILKELLFKESTINKEDYLKLFEDRVTDYNKQKDEAVAKMNELNSKKDTVSTEVNPSDLDIKVVK